MTSKHVNAADVLPATLVSALSEAMGGRSAYLWLPSTRALNQRDRDRRVAGLHAEGFSARAIADRLFLSERTVWRILARKRASAAPSASGPRGSL